MDVWMVAKRKNPTEVMAEGKEGRGLVDGKEVEAMEFIVSR